MLYFCIGIFLIFLLYLLVRGHAAAIRYNKSTSWLVIGSSRRDIRPYYILWIIWWLLLLFFLTFLYKNSNQKDIDNKNQNEVSWNVQSGNQIQWDNTKTITNNIQDPRCWSNMHWEWDKCISNIREIWIQNWKWEEYWLGDKWSAGIITSCNSWYTIFAGECLNIDMLPQELKDKIANIPTPNLPNDCVWWNVDEIIDGDTIVVNGQKVRLIGIDTPESVHPDKPVEFYAMEAKNEIMRLLQKQEVCLSLDKYSTEVDKYNRILRYVYLRNWIFVNAELIRTWYAKAYVVFPFDFMQRFIVLEKEARSNKYWMWR